MKRKLIVIGAVVVLIAVVAVVLWMRSRRPPEEAPALAEVTRGPLRVTVTATGVLEPLTIVEVKSRSGGEIRAMYVEAGDYVQAGQLIAELDPSDVMIRVDQARAQRDAADARAAQTVHSAQAQGQQTQAAISEARAGVQTARARLQQSEAQLAESRVSVEQRITEAEAGVQSARARLAQARTNAATQPQLTQAETTQARASLEVAQRDLERLLAGARPQELAQARSRVAEARAVAENAAENLRRQQTLLEKGFVSQQLADDARRAERTAAAQLDSARQSLDLLEAGARSEEIAAARARVEQAQASLSAARSRSVEVDLRQEDVKAAEATVSQAEAALATARAGRRQLEVRAAELEAARQGLTQSEAGLQRALSGRLQDAAQTENIRASVADLRRAEASLEEIEQTARWTAVVAPRSGAVLDKLVEEGTVIPAGTAALAQGTTIVSIADISEMYLMAQVDEVDIAGIREGMQGEVQVDALVGQSFRAEVVKIFPKAEAEANVVYFPVRIKLLELSPQLRPGMTADVTLTVAESSDALQVPDSAVDRTGRHPTVQVYLGPEQEPEQREVQVGLSDWERTEILAGLSEGQQVVLPPGAAPGARGGFSRPPGPPMMMGGPGRR